MAVLVSVLALLALCVPAALASEVEIGFEHPEITGSEPFGPLGSEAEEKGVVFGPRSKIAERIKDHLGRLRIHRALSRGHHRRSLGQTGGL